MQVKCLNGNLCNYPNCLHKEWHFPLGEFCSESQYCKHGMISRCVGADVFIDEEKIYKESLRIELRNW